MLLWLMADALFIFSVLLLGLLLPCMPLGWPRRTKRLPRLHRQLASWSSSRRTWAPRSPRWALVAALLAPCPRWAGQQQAQLSPKQALQSQSWQKPRQQQGAVPQLLQEQQQMVWVQQLLMTRLLQSSRSLGWVVRQQVQLPAVQQQQLLVVVAVHLQ